MRINKKIGPNSQISPIIKQKRRRAHVLFRSPGSGRASSSPSNRPRSSYAGVRLEGAQQRQKHSLPPCWRQPRVVLIVKSGGLLCLLQLCRRRPCRARGYPLGYPHPLDNYPPIWKWMIWGWIIMGMDMGLSAPSPTASRLPPSSPASDLAAGAPILRVQGR